jgi:hypothetical protein
MPKNTPKRTNIPNRQQLPFAPKRSHHQIPKANTENITAMHPTRKR